MQQIRNKREKKIFFQMLLCPCPQLRVEVFVREEGRAGLCVGGNDEEEASGGSCFSVPADVNEIARWHLNALQKDRSPLLQLSRGCHWLAFPEVV